MAVPIKQQRATTFNIFLIAIAIAIAIVLNSSFETAKRFTIPTSIHGTNYIDEWIGPGWGSRGHGQDRKGNN